MLDPMEGEKAHKPVPSAIISTPQKPFLPIPHGPSSKGVNSGRITRNPYLNYLSEFRKRNPKLAAYLVVKQGASEWRELPKEKKLQYIEAAFYAPKTKIKRLPLAYPEPDECGSKRRRRRRSRKRGCGTKKRKRRRMHACGGCRPKKRRRSRKRGGRGKCTC